MALAPRAVVVHRRSELDELVDRHGTRRAAEFFLATRGRTLDSAQERHDHQEAAIGAVSAAIPADWRRGSVERGDLDRFLFDPEDVLVVVGQDGLVANVAKYLAGQPVIGVDPDPGVNPGVLVRHAASQAERLLPRVVAGTAALEQRTMVRATLDDGQELVALNEVYVGHPSHQSARYRLQPPRIDAPERQSSSGLIVTSGTGATGWCASIVDERGSRFPRPAPDQVGAAWFVREAWPSPATGTSQTEGMLAGGEELLVVGESDALVVFGDGLESDRLVVGWGQGIRLGVAERRLSLVR